jgi:hypothetical protein
VARTSLLTPSFCPKPLECLLHFSKGNCGRFFQDDHSDLLFGHVLPSTLRIVWDTSQCLIPINFETRITGGRLVYLGKAAIRIGLKSQVEERAGEQPIRPTVAPRTGTIFQDRTRHGMYSGKPGFSQPMRSSPRTRSRELDVRNPKRPFQSLPCDFRS